jgi:hypothetical protein
MSVFRIAFGNPTGARGRCPLALSRGILGKIKGKSPPATKGRGLYLARSSAPQPVPRLNEYMGMVKEPLLYLAQNTSAGGSPAIGTIGRQR